MTTTFVPRADWGHTGPRGGHILAAGYARSLVIHHTPGQQPDNYDDAVAEMRQILGTHLGNGWADIGYSWVVWGGYAFEGRGFFRSGAHAPSVNSTSVGVAFLLDGRQRLPTDQEWQAVRDVMARAVAEGAADPGFRVVGHRDVVATECPGQPLYDHLGDYDTLAPAATPPATPPVSTRRRRAAVPLSTRRPGSAPGRYVHDLFVPRANDRVIARLVDPANAAARPVVTVHWGSGLGPVYEGPLGAGNDGGPLDEDLGVPGLCDRWEAGAVGLCSVVCAHEVILELDPAG